MYDILIQERFLMPTYEYECRACHHAFEQFQAMSEEPVKICPVCGKHELRRVIGGGTGIIFKGSGFYINDSKKASSGSCVSCDAAKKKETA